MKADSSITITPSIVEDWEKQATTLERQAKSLRARAEAGKMLLGVEFGNDAEDADSVGPDVEQFDSQTKMTTAIGNIVSETDKPLTKAQMRSRLKELGYPEDRLGNYFYTCIARLKAKRLITVFDDGSIGKPS